MRDDFPKPTKDLLAKRVGSCCSNPECRRPTSGPQVSTDGVVNLGVAAHITAAAQGGPRFDETLTNEQRSDSSNGIWLCQVCAKLIDNDPIRFDRFVLEAWKRSAERQAALELSSWQRKAASDIQGRFAKAERLMPVLLEEMREDLTNHPTTRMFIVLMRGWIYNPLPGETFFIYFIDEHDDLDGKLRILGSLGLIREISFNNVKRYEFTEDFVDYLAQA